MIRRLATVAFVFLAASGMGTRAFGQEEGAQRSFKGDTVRLELSAGNYRVTSSSDDKIRILPRTKSDKVSVRLDVNMLGTQADVRVTGPNDGFDADIELPERVNVVVELAGGSLQVKGIQGSKNIVARTAQIEIAVGERDHYRRVTASVTKGDLTAAPFGEKAHGLRSFEWSGKGAYDLHVRLDAGHVTLKH